MLQLRRDGIPPTPIHNPSDERYAVLVHELATCQQLLEARQGDPLAIVGLALASVIEFMHANQAVLDSGITNPLALILNALHDRRHGGRPPLLFNRPVSGGRPTDQTFDAIKAAAAMGVEVLIAFQVSRQEAGRFVVEQALDLGLKRPDGKPISGRTVLSWRDEIDTAKSEVGAEVFRELKAQHAAAPPLADESQARSLTRQYLVEARLGGFVTHDADGAE